MNELELKTKEWGKELLESIAEDWQHRQDTWQIELNNFEKYGRSFSLTSNTDFSREAPSKRSSKIRKGCCNCRSWDKIRNLG